MSFWNAAHLRATAQREHFYGCPSSDQYRSFVLLWFIAVTPCVNLRRNLRALLLADSGDRANPGRNSEFEGFIHDFITTYWVRWPAAEDLIGCFQGTDLMRLYRSVLNRPCKPCISKPIKTLFSEHRFQTFPSGRLLVLSPAPPRRVSRCPWARHLTLTLTRGHFACLTPPSCVNSCKF